jgi:hypothetical protein
MQPCEDSVSEAFILGNGQRIADDSDENLVGCLKFGLEKIRSLATANQQEKLLGHAE